MVEENELSAPENQAENPVEDQPGNDGSPMAALPARQDDAELALPAADEVSQDELPAADVVGEADDSEMDETTAADQEVEVEARLGEGKLIEEEPEMLPEPVADLVPAQVEVRAVAAGPTRRKPRSAEIEERAARLSDEGVPDFSQVPQPDGESDGRAWYVVHCYSGYENKVRHNLEQRIESMGMKDKIFDVVVPTEEEIEVKEGKRRTVERRVFPGYILVNMVLSEESWYVVRNTPGVTSFVGQGNTPLPLRPEEVQLIVKRMEADAPRIKVTFRQGERVRIVDGPFNDFRGTVSEIDMERAKVRVMVNFFGRETPVELDFLQVEKA